MKPFIISFLLAGIFIGGIIFLSTGGTKPSGAKGENTISNVSVVNGKQIIEIKAESAYSPKKTMAKANIPTIIKVITNGTYGCVKSLNFPSLGLKKFLPPTGETLVELPQQKPGSTIKGICSMGMYSFTVSFN